MSEQPTRYRFGPRSTRGLLAGWRPGQLLAVALGATAGLGCLRTIGGAGGAVLALALTAAGVAAATWPVGGRPIESWLPIILRYATQAAAPREEAPWRPFLRRRPGRSLFSSLRVLPAASREGGPFAVVEDRDAHTWSAALTVGGSGFALLDEAGKEQAVSAWSGVLAALAAEERRLSRLQWITRTLPPREYDLGDLRGGGAEAEAYRDLLVEATPHLHERETLLVVTTEAPRSGRRRERSAVEVVVRLEELLSSLGARLASAGLLAGPPLDEAALSAAVGRSFSLSFREKATSPWPLGTEVRWGCLRTDAAWHACYWVAEWPRGEVGPSVLLPLLLSGRARRAVSLTMAPVPALRAVRRAERERTEGAADAELRRRHGFALTARAHAEQELRLRREAEIAAGHASYLFSGYVTVTAPDEESLERDCAEVEQSAALSQLELRRLFGSQREGFSCTLPTGRGCG